MGHHIEDLIALVREAGYKHGVLFQLNNLDIGEIHSPEEMKYLFNALRDYTQIDGSNWLFVGDLGLRAFIAQQVDRLDDIISYEVIINPLPASELETMINKRIKFYGESKKVELPIDAAVFYYLYEITQGRLKYVFGLISRLINKLYIGDLTDKVTLEIAKPMLIKLGQDRVQRSDLSSIEEETLKLLVANPNLTPLEIAKKLDKTAQYIGRILSSLKDKGLILSNKEGRERTYTPSIDAMIAYTEIS